MKRVEESLLQITVKTGSGHSPVCLVHLGGKSGGEIEDREYKHMLQRIPPPTIAPVKDMDSVYVLGTQPVSILGNDWGVRQSHME